MSRISVLFLEDSPLDVDLARRLLIKQGLEFDLTVVDGKAGYVAALRDCTFDLILSDHQLPDYDGVSALEEARHRCPEVPFIFVSATLGEELAIDMLKLGATDYVLKQRLARLGPSVARALEEARHRRERDRAQAELSRIEKIRDLALKAGRMGLWDWNAATGLVNWSEELSRLFGLAPGAAPRHYREVLALIHPEDQANHDQAVLAAIGPDCTPFERKFRAILPSGATRWFIAQGEATRDDSGAATGLMGVCWDVTEIVRSEERLRTLAEALPDIVWVSRADGYHEYYNSRWYQYSGLSFAASLDRGWSGTIHPEDYGRTLDLWHRSLDGGHPYEVEHRIRGADGLYRWFLARALPQRDDSGAITHWFGTCTDIDDRKRVEEERAEVALHERRRSEQLRQLAAAATRLTTALDVDQIAAVVSEEAPTLIDARRATVCLQPLTDQLDGDLTHAPATHYPGEMTVPVIGRDGRTVGSVRLAEKLLGDFNDDDRAVLVQLAQMASGSLENARLYQELRENDRRKDEFLAMLAHELRNPLAAVSNAVAVGRQEDQDGSRWSFDVIGRQSRHLARLIDDLLDVSRITRGKIRLQREVIEVAPIVRATVEAVQPLIAERKHTLRVHLPPEPLWVAADATRLEQILQNLLTNAAKYTETGGEIELTASLHGGFVAFTFKDNGVGIPPEALPRMFELFAQGDRSLARSEGGLGIGLTLVRTLTEMHGGTITAHSDGPGAGSEFVARIPCANAPAAQTARVERDATSASKRRMKILVVDDNIDTATGLARYLKLRGHEVQTSHDGPAALEVVRSTRPDVALLDIGLPGMDGYEVAARIRTEFPSGCPALIAVSGYGEDQSRPSNGPSPFDHHLVKPIDLGSLIELIATMRPVR